MYLRQFRDGSESSFWGVVTYAVWHICQVADVLSYHSSLARSGFVRLEIFLKGHTKLSEFCIFSQHEGCMFPCFCTVQRKSESLFSLMVSRAAACVIKIGS